MTQHEIASRGPNFAFGVITALALVSLLACTQAQDDADEAAMRAHVEQQAKGGQK